MRNLVQHAGVAELLQSGIFAALLRSIDGGALVAVKATLFDKTPTANWRVQWHQDRVIAVRQKLDLPEYGGWSTKDGVPHVDAPAEVLAEMVALRIHLDTCGADNGALLVIPRTHADGKLAADEIERVVDEGPRVALHAPQDAVIVMRPLLVHSSSAATAPAHRRVLHVECAPADLIAPLRWHSAVPVM